MINPSCSTPRTAIVRNGCRRSVDILLLLSLLSAMAGYVRAKPQSYFFQGDDLGVVPIADPTNPGFLDAARSTLLRILVQRADATGDEVLTLSGSLPSTAASSSGGGSSLHLRFKESIQNVPVDAASLMLHMDETGKVFAVNGEFISARELQDYAVAVDCETALNRALQESGIVDGTWTTNDCADQAIINDSSGRAHKAWKRSVAYGGYQRDLLYASTATGALVARIPQVMTSTSNSGNNGGFVGGFRGI